MSSSLDSAPARWPAPAKINLFLHVTGRRPDGYHEIQTLFQLLDWGDEVIIRPTRQVGITRPRSTYPVAESEDLAVRAALAYLRRRGAARLTCAVPVAPPSTVDVLAGDADEVVCPLQPLRMRSIDEWYEVLPRVGDDEVRRLLRRR